MRVLDLFSGIGGFSLGLERAGMRTVAFCEVDPFCRRVLKKHWPDVPCYSDIRTLTAARLAADGIRIDAICGGFPCQDISVAGKGAGIDGSRSGLWSEYRRLVGELRPRIVFVENVTALLGRGLDRVLGDLAALGFNAEWHCIPAAAVGAPHRRDRVWIVANPDSAGPPHDSEGDAGRGLQSGGAGVAAAAGGSGAELADAEGDGVEGHRAARQQEPSASIGARLLGRDCAGGGAAQWAVEPNVGRMAHGISARVDRLRALGNAVVPQIPEMIGRAIMQKQAENQA
jgi:DNA (cytosine-5)-methyltransferase 1